MKEKNSPRHHKVSRATYIRTVLDRNRRGGFFVFAFLAWSTVTFTLCHVTPYHTGMAHAPIRTACKRRGPKKKGVAHCTLIGIAVGR